jgi:hypothetical protein
LPLPKELLAVSPVEMSILLVLARRGLEAQLGYAVHASPIPKLDAQATAYAMGLMDRCKDWVIST